MAWGARGARAVSLSAPRSCGVALSLSLVMAYGGASHDGVWPGVTRGGLGVRPLVL